mmetsp:Transcript_4719/g.8308  ORF Transcript_4719/g.8308 Transcript_4719/m.8308 type:complete len:350 (+) Transcript_4719:2005-3054(+)
MSLCPLYKIIRIFFWKIPPLHFSFHVSQCDDTILISVQLVEEAPRLVFRVLEELLHNIEPSFVRETSLHLLIEFPDEGRNYKALSGLLQLLVCCRAQSTYVWPSWLATARETRRFGIRALWLIGIIRRLARLRGRLLRPPLRRTRRLFTSRSASINPSTCIRHFFRQSLPNPANVCTNVSSQKNSFFPSQFGRYQALSSAPCWVALSFVSSGPREVVDFLQQNRRPKVGSLAFFLCTKSNCASTCHFCSIGMTLSLLVFRFWDEDLLVPPYRFVTTALPFVEVSPKTSSSSPKTSSSSPTHLSLSLNSTFLLKISSLSSFFPRPPAASFHRVEPAPAPPPPPHTRRPRV